MAKRLSRSGSSTVVEIADDLVDRYTDAGWVEVKPARAESKPATKKESEKSGK